MWGSIIKHALTLGVLAIIGRKSKLKPRDVVEEFLWGIFRTQNVPRNPVDLLRMAEDAVLNAGIKKGSRKYDEAMAHARHEIRREYGTGS